VLKVAHHGSKNASGYQFLRAVNPQYAVISVGADNSYGHPTEETLSRLRDQGCALYRTDLQGDITMTSDGADIVVEVEKNAAADVYAPNDEYEEADTGPGVGDGSGGSGSSANRGILAPPAPAVPTPDTDDYTVYITDTGTKYHADGCRYLSKSKHAVSKSVAIARGLTPCSSCNPG